jgi:acyl dehydratase
VGYAGFEKMRDFREANLHVITSIEDAKALENVEVGVSDWMVIDQQMINRFAQATDDFQWIHVDEERAARELPEGKTIAHGYMTLSLIPTLTVDFVHVENLTRAINFGCNKVRFYTPVPVGARVRARATVLQARKRIRIVLHALVVVNRILFQQLLHRSVPGGVEQFGSTANVLSAYEYLRNRFRCSAFTERGSNLAALIVLLILDRIEVD